MAHPRTRRADRPEIILDAAMELIRRQGGSNLTIDAVAAEAGLSKGGVLHHFPSKDALIAGITDRKVAKIREEIAVLEAGLGAEQSRALLAQIQHARLAYDDEESFPRAFVIAALQSPQALTSFQDLMTETLARVQATSRDPDNAAVLVFATTGLLLTKLMGFHVADPEAKEALFDAMDRLAE